jgi:hypothetical protein
MSEIVKRKASLDSIDYQMLRRQTRYLLRVGVGAIVFAFVAGYIIGSLRSPKWYAGLLGGSIFAGIFAVLWAVVFFIHLLAYLTRKTVVEGTVIRKSIVQAPKRSTMYFLHFEGKQYNVPLAFYEQAQEGRQVSLHFSNILFLFIRGEAL